MSKIKLYLDVVEELRALADCIEVLAQGMADGDSIKKNEALKEVKKEPEKLTVEALREYASEVSKIGDNRVKIYNLLKKYGYKNVSTLPEEKYDSFYADLKRIAEGGG
ncbi:MAG: hypothetical protein IJH94_03460 [Clostridia bacterium]|nr:hypothetical protein [Clostridia bacterium]